MIIRLLSHQMQSCPSLEWSSVGLSWVDSTSNKQQCMTCYSIIYLTKAVCEKVSTPHDSIAWKSIFSSNIKESFSIWLFQSLSWYTKHYKVNGLVLLFPPPQDCKKDPGCCYDKHETPARPLVVQIACNIYSATQWDDFNDIACEMRWDTKFLT